MSAVGDLETMNARVIMRSVQLRVVAARWPFARLHAVLVGLAIHVGETDRAYTEANVSVRKAGAAMPFKSKAQRRKFAELLVQGKISDETFEEWNRETGARKLPERTKPRTTAHKRKVAKKR